jgi:predicted helicase
MSTSHITEAGATARRDFTQLLENFRATSTSERDKGSQFERLMQRFLQTDPTYERHFKHVWLWSEFPFRTDLGGKDTGIDLVAQDTLGDYWAVQCKCYAADARIDKAEVDSFHSTASRSFVDDSGRTSRFAHCLWISTTDNWGVNAEEAIRNRIPPVSRITPAHLQNSAVDWDKLARDMSGDNARKPAHQPLPHQMDAIAAAEKHYIANAAGRGQLIMACGTGKTFTSLRIAEALDGGNSFVLFLVPSIALLGQTLREWTTHATHPIRAICICSDSEVSKHKTKNEDSDGFGVVDLALPASTDTAVILRQLENADTTPGPGLTVVFSTYQSIAVIAGAQKALARKRGVACAAFDLVICDEAHRTTGVTLSGEDESAFVRVHDNAFLPARRRLYMTATPRLYHETAKKTAAENDMVLCSMDDPALYGPIFHHIGFGEAVNRGLLSDYKVLILTVNDRDLPAAAQQMLATGKTEIPAGDINKLIGCINALSKQILGDNGVTRAADPAPMRTAVAFCQSIKISRQITAALNQMGDLYYKTLPDTARENLVTVSADHVDGTMSAPTRELKLNWLKKPAASVASPCHILTNVRCLSEGVDVPSLDAVMFLSARNSQVDVVQSVGRVMRRAPGKKYGYIIIPIVTPSDVSGEKALDNNPAYAVVWTVLNALRAHDDRFAATINKIELNRNKPASIIIGGAAHGEAGDTEHVGKNAHDEAVTQMALQFDQVQTLLYAKLVEKVGDRRYWEQWAADIARIAESEIKTITRLVETPGGHRDAFEKFLHGLRQNINPSISAPAAIEMLAQHRITQPVFEALFENHSFAGNNPVSKSMESMLAHLGENKPGDGSNTLQKFYDSVRERARGIDNAKSRQDIIVELYDKFFRTAFPLMVERLGIVYTPVEVVDFIIHSVAAILKKEFNRELGDENIHILDPFTGTGTFITRLLQSGHITPKDFLRKYTREIHANEIVLLAYYIASVNIENVFHELQGGDGSPDRPSENNIYTPFPGICLTDTFQLGETKEGEDFLDEIFPANAARVRAQKKAPLRIIIGNPPYSIGQKSANDNARNQDYPKLNERIEKTYAKGSAATLVRGLYDSYIKAFRWASDRLDSKNGGVICFITNGGWIDTNGMDAFRRCLENEFSSIYVFSLRGAIRGRSGDNAKKEGQNVFDIMTGVSITLLVRNPNHTGKAVIHYHDIGDYLTRVEKLSIIQNFHDIANPAMSWRILAPNVHNDWINQRNDAFQGFVPLAPEKKFDIRANSFFILNIIGVVTNRDAWIYGFSQREMETRLGNMIDFYNEQTTAFQETHRINDKLKVENFVSASPDKISWTRALRNHASKGDILGRTSDYRIAIYRPFCVQYLYFDKNLIEMPGLSRKLFPASDTKNIVICVSCAGTSKDMSILMTDKIADLHFIGDTQCFPLYWYEDRGEQGNQTLFDRATEPQAGRYVRRDGISDFILNRIRKLHGPKTTKEDIFYYVYALLHNPDYRATFAADLKKMLPRIPLLEGNSVGFWKYVAAGRELAGLHLHYENHAENAKNLGVIIEGQGDLAVTKMRFEKNGKDDNKSAIRYNTHRIIRNIPAEAYDYIVNGKSAIEWVMERYQVTTHKESGIVNDPNDWSCEQNQPDYIHNLILSVIAISVQTVRIVKALPKIDFSSDSINA